MRVFLITMLISSSSNGLDQQEQVGIVFFFTYLIMLALSFEFMEGLCLGSAAVNVVSVN